MYAGAAKTRTYSQESILMPSLNDLLNEEVADGQRAAAYAAAGVSMTGFTGRHTSIDRDALFGAPAEPIVGERVSRMAPTPNAGADVDLLIAGDPVFARRLIEPVDRQPFGGMDQQLYWAPRPGYRRYWFTDQPGRVARAKRAGYSHVPDPDTGEPLSRVTDRSEGRGRASYLMEIPIQWYQADMTRQAELLRARLDDIRYGRAGPGHDDNRYIPASLGGIRITGR